MKRILAACLVAALATTAFVGDAEARRRGRTEVIQTAPAIDINTLLLLGALGGGGGGMGLASAGVGGGLGLLPFLLAPQTTVVETRRHHHRSRVK